MPLDIHTSLVVAFLALAVERVTGYPGFLQRAIRHPVEWIGALIERLDEMLNDPTDPGWVQRLKGGLALAILIAMCAALTWPFTVWLRQHPWSIFVEAGLAVPFLAQRDLRVYVRRVADGLDAGLDEGRAALSHIVGRDPWTLDESGVARGAVESLAENASDGVVAPAFWLCLLGLPGIVLYKAVNTADSMIGHLSPRYRRFGWAAARFDDLVNLVPARLTGLLFAGSASLTSPSAAAAALERMWYDAGRHASPNAGWPESAVAGALDIRLGGPRSYGGRLVDLPWMGSGRTELDRADIRRALGLLARTLTLFTVLVGFLAAFS